MITAPWMAMALVAGLSVTAGGVLLAGGHAAAVRVQSQNAHHSYDSQVRTLDDYVEQLTARQRLDPVSWLIPESLAKTYRTRAQLTGDYVDYGRARDAISLSFSIAPPGAGPFLARAQLDATMHCWDRIEPDLVRVEHSDPHSFEQAAVDALRAERDFQSGRYPEALAGYRTALRLEHAPMRYFALADAENTLGDHVAADLLLDQAESLQSHRDYFSCAFIQFQRGVIFMNRGLFDQAEERFGFAESVMPGWWRVQGRLADLQVVRGDLTAATASYISLVAQTANPEFMDDLARIAPDPATRERYRSMARSVYDSEMTDYPQAACAHALDHFLDLEHEPELTLRLAEQNYRLRPGGEASTKLARAYLQAGRLPDAVHLIETVLATPWDMPLLHRTAAQIFTASGNTQRAAHERALCTLP